LSHVVATVTESWDSSVSNASDYGLDGWCSILSMGRDPSLHSNVPVGKVARVWSWPLTSGAKIWRCGAILPYPLHNCMRWCLRILPYPIFMILKVSSNFDQILCRNSYQNEAWLYSIIYTNS
jgi:hypothetical protein